MRDSAPPTGKRPINARLPTSVLKPLKGIVGELRTPRGNKVFQVVTPARQGLAGFFTSRKEKLRHYFRRSEQKK